MKQKFLSFSLNLIKSNNNKLDEIKLDEIRYGLEGLYLLITKTIIIFSIALILNIFKEMLLLLLFFNILRTTGYGIHATKSGICLFSSTSLFIILPFIAKMIIIPIYIKIVLGIISIILIYKNTPADTSKRPILNKKKRERDNFITTINCIIMIYFFVLTNNNMISNLLIFGIYIEVFLTSPFIYKIFNLSYNNYLNYNLD